MNKDIENIIRANLPEKKDVINKDNEIELKNAGFNQAISQINTKLIADEVLKVVVETCCKDCRKMIELSNEKTQ